jgi:hypothetical protein
MAVQQGGEKALYGRHSMVIVEWLQQWWWHNHPADDGAALRAKLARLRAVRTHRFHFMADSHRWKMRGRCRSPS